MLDWSMEKLAALSDVPRRTLIRFEGGEGAARPATIAAIREALEAAGIEFIPEDGGGPGVRLREHARAMPAAASSAR